MMKDINYLNTIMPEAYTIEKQVDGFFCKAEEGKGITDLLHYKCVRESMKKHFNDRFVGLSPKDPNSFSKLILFLK